MAMTKRDLVVLISKETGLPQQDVTEVLEKILSHITEALARGETVEFRNFGVFEVKMRRPRVGRNPNKPENTVIIPPRNTVKFKMGKIMKAMVTGRGVPEAQSAMPTPVTSAPSTDVAPPVERPLDNPQ